MKFHLFPKQVISEYRIKSRNPKKKSDSNPIKNLGFLHSLPVIWVNYNNMAELSQASLRLEEKNSARKLRMIMRTSGPNAIRRLPGP